jgi:hypothetical protein
MVTWLIQRDSLFSSVKDGIRVFIGKFKNWLIHLQLVESKGLTMVYNTHNYWVSGLCPLFGILNTRKYNISETGCFHQQVREADNYFVGSLRKSEPQTIHTAYHNGLLTNILHYFWYQFSCILSRWSFHFLYSFCSSSIIFQTFRIFWLLNAQANIILYGRKDNCQWHMYGCGRKQTQAIWRHLSAEWRQAQDSTIS